MAAAPLIICGDPAAHHILGLIQGAAEAAAEAGLAVVIRDAGTQTLAEVATAPWSGLLVCGPSAEGLRALHSCTGRPVVVWSALPHRFVRISTDHRAIGRLAGEHLRAAGCLRIGYVGVTRDPAERERHAGLRAITAASWITSYACDADAVARLTAWCDAGGDGIFCFNDAQARQVVRDLHACGRRVPDAVRVLGSGDAPLICRFESPALSSIDVGFRRLGLAAVEMLRDLAAGKRARLRRLGPVGVVARASTRGMPQDPALAAALAFIRTHATEAVGVAHAAHAAGLSRRVFERRCHDELGCSPLELFQRQRMEIARQALAAGTGVAATAALAGFASSDHFARAFRRRYGVTPAAWRAAAAP